MVARVRRARRQQHIFAFLVALSVGNQFIRVHLLQLVAACRARAPPSTRMASTRSSLASSKLDRIVALVVCSTNAAFSVASTLLFAIVPRHARRRAEPSGCGANCASGGRLPRGITTGTSYADRYVQSSCSPN